MNPQITLFGAAHDPGGKVSLDLPVGVKGAAVFTGAKEEYRPKLERTWGAGKRTVLFVMMNPSTASPHKNDPTVAKICRYADGWGYERVLVGNIFSYRATSPKDLLSVSDPIGPENDKFLLAMAAEAHLIVFAYGKPPKKLQERGPRVAWMLRAAGHILHVLQLCADGTPGHPLYLRGDLQPTRWEEQ